MTKREWNKYVDRIFCAVGIGTTFFGLIVLFVLLWDVFTDGFPRLRPDFFFSFPSRKPELAGIFSAWVGTIWIMCATALMAIPLGVGAGIYLEEYSRKNWMTDLIEINIANLAGVPSVVYGILGLGIFGKIALNVDGNEIYVGRTILAGGMILSLLILPIIIMSTREALRAVPFSLREASYALGATKWQTVFHQILPASIGNMMTGIILAMSRAIGETAPLITLGALTYIPFLPSSPISFSKEVPFLHLTLRGFLDHFTVLPIQIFNWVSRPQKGFLVDAAAGIVVLLGITLLMNAVAVYLRHKNQRRW